MITLIVACDRNSAIGKNNEIPWHIPADLAMFKQETAGGAVIMGRRTWYSLPYKPLKGRHNFVVSSCGNMGKWGVGSTSEAISKARSLGCTRIYGIGGSQIYSDLLPLAQRLLVTKVDLTVEGADTFFPSLDLRQWTKTEEFDLQADHPKCTCFEYMRRNR